MQFFFSTTLVFKKNNDKVVYNIHNKTPSGNIAPNLEKRGRQVSHNKYQHTNLVNEYIESYHPTISHYRREQRARSQSSLFAK